KILATDINTIELEKAKKAKYSQHTIETVAKRVKWFEMIQDNLYQIKPKIKDLVYFKYLNLLDEWPIKYPFHAIFFRNVSIYMEDELTNAILKKMDDYLFPL